MKSTYNLRTRLTVSCIAALVSSAVLLEGCGTSSQTAPQSAAPSNAASTAPSAAPAAKIKVVAAENFYGEVAQAVGGDRVQVTSILNNPEADPHEYEPTPDASKAVSDSQLVVYNGVGYDGWMDKLLKAGSSATSKSVIKVADDLMGKTEGENEHVWYDPTSMPKLANKIADELTKLDPSQDQTFHKNAQAYIASLDPLTQKIQKLKQSSPVAVDVSEPVFDYMAAALNLNVGDPKFAKAIDENTDPAPADLAGLQNDIKNKKIKLFVYNVQNSSPTVDNVAKLAKSSGVPIVEVTETEPKGKNYLQWMMDQLDQVEKALPGK